MPVGIKFDPTTATVNRKIRKALKDTVVLARGTARELIQGTAVSTGDFEASEFQAYQDLGDMLDSLGS